MKLIIPFLLISLSLSAQNKKDKKDSINLQVPVMQTDTVYKFSATKEDWLKLYYVLRKSKALTGDQIEDMIEEIEKHLEPIIVKKQ